MNTNLVLNVLPRFPAHIRATDGLTIVVENGVDQVIKPDFGALVPVPAVTNPATTYFQAWDQSINYYQSISFQDFANNLADQVLVGTLLALSEVTFAADQGVYFSDANTAHAYGLSAFVRGISSSADAATFKTGLSLTKSDVGLANVDNTSDANKPVSTAQQTALNLKAPLASPPLTGTPTAPTAAPGTNTAQLATTAFVTAAIGGAKKFAILQDQKASGTAGGATAGAAWTPLVLNTEVADNDNIATLTTNTFVSTIDALIRVNASFYATGSAMLRLFNVTDGAVVAYGPSAGTSAGITGSAGNASLEAKIVAGKTYRIDYYVTTTQASNGRGQATSNGATEVYATATIQGLAA
jgi:hypothetical protein